MGSSRQRQPYSSVFLSSTSPDLIIHRQLVIDTLLRMNLFPVGMEQFGGQGSSDGTSVSTAKIAEADIYVGIFRQAEWLQVYAPSREALSVAQQEYLEARKLGLPCYVFLAHPDTQHDDHTLFPDNSHNLDSFPPLLGLLDELLPAVVEYFTTPDNLARKVAMALAKEVKTGQRPPRDFPPPNLHFVGREQEVRNLCETLRKGQSVLLIAGVSGIGKSALAAQAAYVLATEPGTFPGGFAFVRCDERRDLAGLIWIYDQLLSAWNITLALEDLAYVTSPEAEASLREHVLRNQMRSVANEQPAPSLLLLDNVEHELPLTRALEVLTPLKITVVLTSRTEFYSEYLQMMHLDALKPPDALALFKERYISRGGGWVAMSDEAPVAEVVKMLGYLPLAIELVAACAACTHAGVADLVSEIQEPSTLARLKESIDRAATVHYSLEKGLSILTPNQQARFAALGLPAGPDWPRPVIERLFSAIQLDKLDASLPEVDLDLFAELSLVKILPAEMHPLSKRKPSAFVSPHIPQLPPPRVRLHPLLRDLASKEWDKQPLSVQRVALEGLLEGVGMLAKEYIHDFAALEREEELITGALRLVGQTRLAQQAFIEVINILIGYLSTGGHWQLGRELLTLQLDARRDLGDRVGESLTLNNLGSLAEDLGKIEEAARYYEQALAIRREVGDRTGEGVALNNLGHLAYSLGKIEEAARYYEQALLIRREVGDRAGESTTLNNLGVLATERGETKEAAHYYEQALAILRTRGDQAGESSVLNNLGLLMANLGRKEEAARYYEQALIILREVGDRAKEGRTLNNLGHLAEELGKTEEAARYYTQALAILRKIGDRAGEGGALNNLGHLAHSLGKTEEAVHYYEQALVILREVSNQIGESTILYNLGYLMEDLGKKDNAVNYYEQALVIWHKVGGRVREGTILSNLGRLAEERGKTEEAAHYYEQALTIWREVGERVEEGATLKNLGELAHLQSKEEEAARYYEQALGVWREVSNRTEEGNTLLTLGKVAENLGKTEEAAHYYEQALIVWRETGERVEEGVTLNNLGALAAGFGKTEEAVRYYEQALDIWHEMGSQVGEGTTLNNLGVLMQNMERKKEAVRYFEQAVAIWREVEDRTKEVITLNYLGHLLHQCGDTKTAVGYFNRALVMCEEIGAVDWAHSINQLLAELV